MEVEHTPGSRAPVLFLPGGHCTARTPVGQRVYADLGHEVVSVSRPGYGRTAVGTLSCPEFTPLLRDVADALEIDRFAAVVGVSFGGLQAVDVAGSDRVADRLILHSCAPSRFPFPDTWAERVGAPVVFGFAEPVAWAAMHRLARSERGLALLMKPLSSLPWPEWFERWSPTERSAAREVYLSMRSGRGFRVDLRQAGPGLAAEREAAQRRVALPALVTFTPNDGSVHRRHAWNFADTIPEATVVELPAASHLFWIGPGRPVVSDAIRRFLATSD
ncbi:alpha/beta hydrolase [Intrasporangium sp. DVR]|uniref:alpha/beta fold hydrolase n=1 Tax=Intrasporangium sp. DVR TaxID=3127867 RepID=UPI00313A6E61